MCSGCNCAPGNAVSIPTMKSFPLIRITTLVTFSRTYLATAEKTKQDAATMPWLYWEEHCRLELSTLPNVIFNNSAVSKTYCNNSSSHWCHQIKFSGKGKAIAAEAEQIMGSAKLGNSKLEKFKVWTPQICYM